MTKYFLSVVLFVILLSIFTHCSRKPSRNSTEQPQNGSSTSVSNTDEESFQERPLSEIVDVNLARVQLEDLSWTLLENRLYEKEPLDFIAVIHHGQALTWRVDSVERDPFELTIRALSQQTYTIRRVEDLKAIAEAEFSSSRNIIE